MAFIVRVKKDRTVEINGARVRFSESVKMQILDNVNLRVFEENGDLFYENLRLKEKPNV